MHGQLMRGMRAVMCDQNSLARSNRNNDGKVKSVDPYVNRQFLYCHSYFRILDTI